LFGYIFGCIEVHVPSNIWYSSFGYIGMYTPCDVESGFILPVTYKVDA
jgi:hypothetical protein